jgi:hypothetical protein
MFRNQYYITSSKKFQFKIDSLFRSVDYKNKARSMFHQINKLNIDVKRIVGFEPEEDKIPLIIKQSRYGGFIVHFKNEIGAHMIVV